MNQSDRELRNTIVDREGKLLSMGIRKLQRMQRKLDKNTNTLKVDIVDDILSREFGAEYHRYLTLMRETIKGKK